MKNNAFNTTYCAWIENLCLYFVSVNHFLKLFFAPFLRIFSQFQANIGVQPM
jgi:hypothetical protein